MVYTLRSLRAWSKEEDDPYKGQTHPADELHSTPLKDISEDIRARAKELQLWIEQLPCSKPRELERLKITARFWRIVKKPGVLTLTSSAASRYVSDSASPFRVVPDRETNVVQIGGVAVELTGACNKKTLPPGRSLSSQHSVPSRSSSSGSDRGDSSS